MKAIVIGAGRMGQAVAYDLLAAPGVDAVTLADLDRARLDVVAQWLHRRRPGARSRLALACLDARDTAAAAKRMRGSDVAFSTSSYELNVGLARAAIDARAGFVDLGGNNTVVDRELALDGAARAAGVTIVPDCGLAPGMVSLLVADGIDHVDEARSVAIRVGGLPLHPKPPLDYQLVFSVKGLTNEYLEPAVVLRDGVITKVPSMTEVETLTFPRPFGRLEAFQTSGGTSTLPYTYRDRLRSLDYKTIRYPGHCAKIRTLMDLGLLSGTPIEVDGATVAPRAVVEAVLGRVLPQEGPDVVLVRVTIDGKRRGRRVLREYQLIEHADERLGLTAMMRTTAFPAAVVGWMIGTGRITTKGALPQERCIPAGLFIEELGRRGLTVRVREIAAPITRRRPTRRS